MEIPTSDWSFAQDLLVRLVQILTPLAQGRSKEGDEISLLSKRLFVPPAPSENKKIFPYPVRLLNALHQAQKQMSHWIEELAPEGGIGAPKRGDSTQSGGASKALHSAEKMGEGGPIGKLAGASLAKTLHPAEKVGEGRLVQAGRSSLEKGGPSGSVEKSVPLETQAQKLLIQVRGAIQSLSSSLILNDPKRVPFREAIRKLKPLVDELVEAVGRGDMHSGDEDSPFSKEGRISPLGKRPLVPSKQLPLPLSPWVREKRQETLKARDVAPSSRKEGAVERSASQIGDSRRPSLSGPRPDPDPAGMASSKRASQTGGESVQKGVPSQAASIRQPPLPVESTISSGRGKAPSEDKERISPAHSERNFLPGGPYSPQMQASPVEKSKKKRKSLWTREEDEDEEPRRDR